MGFKLVNGTNFSLTVSVDSEEEATNLFNKLSAGGQVNMPLQKTFWGAFFGMLKDKFGINWMVSYSQNQQY
jgi:PhnB protein